MASSPEITGWLRRADDALGKPVTRANLICVGIGVMVGQWLLAIWARVVS